MIQFLRGFVGKHPKICGHLSLDGASGLQIEVWNADQTRILGKFKLRPDISMEERAAMLTELLRMIVTEGK